MSRTIFAIFLCLLSISSASAYSWTRPFAWARRKRYTPLVMFYDMSAPRDDKYHMALEKAVREVEWEFGVPVDRVGVSGRNCAHYALRELTMRDPPFLYNRESCQSVYVKQPPRNYNMPGDDDDDDLDEEEIAEKKRRKQAVKRAGLYRKETETDTKIQTVLVNRRQLRAWAKGRILAPQVDEHFTLKPVVRTSKFQKD